MGSGPPMSDPAFSFPRFARATSSIRIHTLNAIVFAAATLAVMERYHRRTCIEFGNLLDILVSRLGHLNASRSANGYTLRTRHLSVHLILALDFSTVTVIIRCDTAEAVHATLPCSYLAC